MIKQQIFHLFLVPNQVAAIGILKEVLKGNIGSSQDNLFTIQIEEFVFARKISPSELFPRFVGNIIVGFQCCAGHLVEWLFGR
jgi:hypothetical protein